MKFTIKLISTIFYIGYLPAGGTFATIVTLPLIEILSKKSFLFNFGFIIIIILLSMFIASYAEKYFDKKDDKRIVIDEIVGFLVAMFLIDITRIYTVIMGIILFRFLDIIKPGFKKIQQLPSWTGIIGDDVVAGVITNVLLRIISFC